MSENSLFDIGDCTGFDIYKPHAFLTTYNTNKLSNDLITMRNIKEDDVIENNWEQHHLDEAGVERLPGEDSWLET